MVLPSNCASVPAAPPSADEIARVALALSGRPSVLKRARRWGIDVNDAVIGGA